MELETCGQEGGTINFVARTAVNNDVVAKVCHVEGKTPQPAARNCIKYIKYSYLKRREALVDWNCRMRKPARMVV